ncbi:MAG: hypothetical protein M0R06_02150 [Sphaerochaeta sp.]|nr:hypothetical protein [Sphaerochaeta sp.]
MEIDQQGNLGAELGPDDFEAWLATGTVRTVEVPIYMDAAIVDEMDALDVELKEAQKGDPEFDDSAILEKMEELSARFEASKATFTLHAVPPDDKDTIWEKFPDETAPRPLPPGAPDSAVKAHAKRFAQWQNAARTRELDKNLAYVAAAIAKVTFASGKTLPTPTTEQLRALRNRAHGEAQFDRLLMTAMDLTKREVKPSRPSLPAS